MAGIRLEFAQFGDFDSFDVIRSTSSMSGIADVDLPSPIVTGLNTMYYIDTGIVENQKYYYRVAVWRDGIKSVSEQITSWATESVVVIWSDFTTNIIDDTGKKWTAINGAAVSGGALVLNRPLNQRLEMPYSADFHFTSSEDVTIRCKAKVNSFNTDRRVLITTRKDVTGGNNWCIYLNPNLSIDLFIWNGNGSVLLTKNWASFYSFGVEFEMSLERKGMVWYLYKNGIQVATTAAQASNYTAYTASKLTIGSENNTGSSPDLTRDLDGTIRYLQILKN